MYHFVDINKMVSFQHLTPILRPLTPILRTLTPLFCNFLQNTPEKFPLQGNFSPIFGNSVSFCAFCGDFCTLFAKMRSKNHKKRAFIGFFAEKFLQFTNENWKISSEKFIKRLSNSLKWGLRSEFFRSFHEVDPPSALRRACPLPRFRVRYM